MFAVWNGKKLELIECENKSHVIFAAARKAAGNAYLEMMPMSYINSSVMMHTIHSAKIAILCDEDGRNKNLPVTLKVDNFSLLGPVIFLGKSKQDFIALDSNQIEILRKALERLSLSEE